MDFLEITGGKTLRGSVKIAGAKNAALPVIAASILSKKPVLIDNLPDVVDIKTLLRLLEMLGAGIEHSANCATVDSDTITSQKAIYEIVAQMRASILVLGPLLTRFGHCEVSLPGGCAIGQRPIDLHLKALEAMGAEIEIKSGYVVARAPKGGLRGAEVVFDKITVGGTENVLTAAAMANGTTTIINAAREPEIVQLCHMLQSGGVRIEGVGTSVLKVEGTGGERLDISEVKVIPDRIEAGTYLCAGAITRSEIEVTGVDPQHMVTTIDKLEEMGYRLSVEKERIAIAPPKDMPRAVRITTSEYPGFPTDMQAQFMAVATLAEGETLIEERLFENRFMHVSELNRLGADIWLKGNIAAVRGVKKLYGADVMATDLRASSALVLAALAAEGTTRIRRIYHLDRGYENLEGKLRALGAEVVRKSD